MAKLTPEELEQKIHALLREQPVRRAPVSLESRVLGEIARRQALPWWQQSYSYWPNPMKLAFMVLATGATGVAVLLSMQVVGLVSAESVSQVFAPITGAWHTLSVLGGALGGIVRPYLPNLSSTYLYAALAVVGGAYALMLGLGATAYRLLWQQR